jgi:hypothetical protein
LVPSILGIDSSKSARTAKLERAARISALDTFRAEAPWLGYVPDLDTLKVGPTACSEMTNLQPYADPSRKGLVLQLPRGFREIDPTYDGSSGTQLGDDVNTTNDIIGLAFYPRTNHLGKTDGNKDDTIMAISAGDKINAGSCQLWRLVPVTGLWEEVTHSGDADSVELKSDYPQDETQPSHLFDTAVFYPLAVSPRTDLTQYSAGQDTEPLFVFTNGTDPVSIYPVPATTATPTNGTDDEYEAITTALGTGVNLFKARSVENWASRLMFLNTEESGTKYRQRLRWTAVGNGDPDPVNDGSGALDLKDFDGEGLRCEQLGNLLACYFTDGIALVQRSGQSTAPFSYQTITTSKGLLGGRAVTAISQTQHFGLFTDGWYILDSNGQFTEIGMLNGEPKWRETFFARLERKLVARISIEYDPKNKLVYIALPLDGQLSNTETWIYDLARDAVYPTDIAATYYAKTNVVLTTDILIDDLTGTIDDLGSRTINSFGPTFGLQNVVHGTGGGLVMVHGAGPDDNPYTRVEYGSRNPITPSYTYETTVTSVGNPLFLKRINEVSLEYTSVSSTTASMTVTNTDEGGTSVNKTFGLSGATVGANLVTTFSPYLTGVHIAYRISGQGPVKFNSFTFVFQDLGVRPLRSNN